MRVLWGWDGSWFGSLVVYTVLERGGQRVPGMSSKRDCHLFEAIKWNSIEHPTSAKVSSYEGPDLGGPVGTNGP